MSEPPPALIALAPRGDDVDVVGAAPPPAVLTGRAVGPSGLALAEPGQRAVRRTPLGHEVASARGSPADIAAMDPERLTAEEIARLPPEAAPRLILLKGLFNIGDMDDLGRFFVDMGYPEAKVRHADGSLAISSHRSSGEISGTVAWYYEREGVPPILIGHSQGGFMATKVLYDLAGQGDPVEVWNPLEGRTEGRTTIRDPHTGEERSTAGLRLPLTATLATGRLMRALLPWQWPMMPRLYTIPDSAERFLSFNMRTDVIGVGWEASQPAAGSRAEVRNLRLPDDHSHIGLPDTSHLARAPASRRFIDEYDLPRRGSAELIVPDAPPETNLIQAAELWRAVTRAWCVEAQRRLAARSSAQ